MHVMINQYVVFDLFCGFIDGGVRVCGELGEGSNFQLVRGPQKLSSRVFSSRRSSLSQIFVGSCVDFEVAHLSHGSEIAIPRDSYLKLTNV